MRGAKGIRNTLPDSLLADPAMNRFFEAFLSVELHVLLRFGKWQEILDTPLSASPEVGVCTCALGSGNFARWGELSSLCSAIVPALCTCYCITVHVHGRSTAT
jgi:hypothetical protein